MRGFVPSLRVNFLMPNRLPIQVKIEFRAVFFDMAPAAGGTCILRKPFLRILAVLQARPVAHFALYIFELRRIDLTDKSTRFSKADGMAGQAFRIE